MATLYVTHPRYVEHEPAPHIPEQPRRIRAVWRLLDETGLAARMTRREATFAPIDTLALVHTRPYLELLSTIPSYQGMVRLDVDTYANPESYDTAVLSAGGVVDAAVAVARGEAANGLAVTRPPGHHAMPDRSMGFCIINNVAVAARAVQRQYSVERVLILDYDIHHGNGTETAFYDDPSVLFISIHQWPLYPGTGTMTDIGRGAGRGYNINVPIGPGSGDRNYAAIYEQVIWPAAIRFQPQMVLVSVGHDAHWREPISGAGMRLSLSGYSNVARESIRIADELCGGKVVFVMEGGYDTEVLAYEIANIARALLGDADTVDPLGPPDDVLREPDITSLIQRIQHVQGLTK